MKYVLFDLDGTLLPLDTESFINHYLKVLSKKMASCIEPDAFVPKLLKATEAMILNLEEKTNEEVFTEHFFIDCSESKTSMLKQFEDFYLNEFKSLQIHSKPNPHAMEVLDYLNSKGVGTVIATNPVFPLIAIKERIRWAGVDEYEYKLITSYENMKYCKPHLHYYEQILEEINAKPEECLMVGNDMQEDMVASRLGMKTFLVEDYLIDNNTFSIEPTYRGTFADFRDCIMELI
ncbi:HAD family hydrolase [Desulfitibacter alkalitolerans]|uniref:HAD family hydrolase n=1 Tax=Desulfitibacter alkalitolerans TaxID=264641 RepID=UPI00048155CC|nr:HAD family hydrolase [Desulfitibacter alkalitolerans]